MLANRAQQAQAELLQHRQTIVEMFKVIDIQEDEIPLQFFSHVPTSILKFIATRMKMVSKEDAALCAELDSMEEGDDCKVDSDQVKANIPSQGEWLSDNGLEDEEEELRQLQAMNACLEEQLEESRNIQLCAEAEASEARADARELENRLVSFSTQVSSEAAAVSVLNSERNQQLEAVHKLLKVCTCDTTAVTKPCTLDTCHAPCGLT